MTLANETGQEVSYWITCDGGGPDCGDISVDGIAEWPSYDNQTNVNVGFKPAGGATQFSIQVGNTGTGQQIEIALLAE